MKRIYTIILLALVAAISSCERRPLVDELHETALIPVSIDWSEALLDPDNDPNGDVYSASVWLFPQPDSRYQGKPLEFKLNNPRGGEIEVPVGKYAVLVFNNTVMDFSENVGFRGTDKYETFEYYALPDTRASRYSKSGYDNLILEPDIIAAWNLDEFEVTPDMVTLTRSTSENSSLAARQQVKALSNVTPHRLTYVVKSLVRVVGLNNAKAAQGAVTGFGSSVFLATGRVAPPPSTLVFNLNNRQWLNSEQTVGTIESAPFNAFGPASGDPSAACYHLTSFTLRGEWEGSTTYPTPPAAPFTHYITNQINKNISLYINLNVGFEVKPGNPEIVLPDFSIQGDGGFGVGLEDWGEEVVIPL